MLKKKGIFPECKRISFKFDIYQKKDFTLFKKEEWVYLILASLQLVYGQQDLHIHVLHIHKKWFFLIEVRYFE